MRAFISTAALVMVASFIQFESMSIMPMAASASARTDSSELRRDGQDRVSGIIAGARKALGGEDKVAGLKTLTAEGPFRRSMGGRDMEGTVTVTLARPDKMHRLEEMAMGGMVGGPTIERTMVLNGDHGVGRHAEPRWHGRRNADRDGGSGAGPRRHRWADAGTAERSARAPHARADAAADGGTAC